MLTLFHIFKDIYFIYSNVELQGKEKTEERERDSFHPLTHDLTCSLELGTSCMLPTAVQGPKKLDLPTALPDDSVES